MYEAYVDEIQRELGLHATWPVNAAVRLGDIGVFKDGVFERKGSLATRNIKFRRRVAKPNGSIEYKSSNGTTTQLKAVAAPTSSAQSFGFSIKFSRANAIFVSATKCAFVEIEDQEMLGIDILDQYRKGLWEKDHAVVTSVIESEDANILVSSSDDGLAEFLVPKDPPIIDAEAKLVEQRGLSIRVTAASSVTPFFKTRRVARKWWVGEPKFLNVPSGEGFLGPDEPQRR